jgi:hypothetical protein
MENIELVNVLQQLKEDLKEDIILIDNDLENLLKNYNLNSDLIKRKYNLKHIKEEQLVALNQALKSFKMGD